MKPSAGYTWNVQRAGYAYDQRDEMGVIDFPSFQQEFEKFPWGEQMVLREKMAGGCSATISVEDLGHHFVLWVSVMGDEQQPTFLLGAVRDFVSPTCPDDPEDPFPEREIRIAPSAVGVLNAFRLLFEGEYGKLNEQLGSYPPYDWKP